MAKIKDVAQLAGVSASTVSLVLNRKGYVSEPTRQRVEKAIRDLHYIPSEVARNFSLSRSNLIGVIIPDLAHPFFATLVQEIERALYPFGFRTMVCSTNERENGEAIFLDMLQRQTMDGLIVGAHAVHMELYQNIKRPLLAFDRYLTDQIPMVRADHVQGGQLVAEALLKRKSRHVVQIIGSASVRTPAHAHETILARILKTHGVQIHSIVMPANAFHAEDFSRAAREVFVRYPETDAIVATDLGAMAAMGEAIRSGRRVPNDVAIVAYDGTYLTRLAPLCLSAVVQPFRALGQKSAQAIAALVHGETLPDLTPLAMQWQRGETC